MALVTVLLLPVGLRRFHDSGLSGWTFLALVLIGPFFRIFVPACSNIAGQICDVAMVVLLIKPGTNGKNKYGRDPLAPGYYNAFLK